MISQKTILGLWIFWLSAKIQVARASCWFKNGTKARDYFPCDPTDNTSLCCPGFTQATLCYSDDGCFVPETGWVEPACTIKGWSSCISPSEICAIIHEKYRQFSHYVGGGHRAKDTNVLLLASYAHVECLGNPLRTFPYAIWGITEEEFEFIFLLPTKHPTSPASTTRQPPPIASEQSNSSPTPTAPNLSNESYTTSSSLAAGARAGIAVGAASLAVCLVVIVWLIVKLRKKEAQLENALAESQRHGSSVEGAQKKTIESGASGIQTGFLSELDNSSSIPIRLQPPFPVYELPATSIPTNRG